MIQKKYLPSALVLYLSFFVHGIGVSIMGQYKPQLAGMWGGATLADGSIDVSAVIMVSAALGLGRLVSLPVSGWVSDRFGRKPSALIGILCYIVYFVGIVFSPNMYVAYVIALFGGMANSFIDTGAIPACMEILVGKSGLASMLTKFFISAAQFLLPFMMGFVAVNNLSFRTIFFLMASVLAVIAVLGLLMPLPPSSAPASGGNKVKQKMKFTPEAIAVILIGFTSTSTFQLGLNCNQEFGKLSGMENPAQIQSFYSVGSILAVLITSVLVGKFKPVRFLFLYPLASLASLVIVYAVRTPAICLFGGFAIGFFAAGGVLQLANATVNYMFPQARGKITSIIMIASSLANYIILSVAGMLTSRGGMDGPLYVILLNIAVTAVGILLALFVNLRFGKMVDAAAAGTSAAVE